MTTKANLPKLVTLYVDGNQLKSVAGLENLKWLTTLSLSRNRISDVSPVAGLRAPSLVMAEQNRIKDLEPLLKAARADLAGGKNWAPFLRLYLKGNPLSSKSKKGLEELGKEGLRADR